MKSHTYYDHNGPLPLMERTDWEEKKRNGLVYFLEAFIRETSLFEKGAEILVGVSGGPDSMALLALLEELRPRWGLHLHVLHCHHGLRPEAEEEAEFVRRWAAHWGLPFSLVRLPVQAFRRAAKRSLQDAARELRYQAFWDTAQAVGAEHIALGHTADDQAEEVLIGLIRGAGLGGLAAMPLRRGPFIRPLLGVYRSEILAYLHQRNIPYCLDPSNQDLHYLRARVRHHLIPELKKYSPNIVRQLNKTSRLLQADEAFLQEKAREWAAEILHRNERGVELQRQKLAALPQALASRILLQAILSAKGDLRRVGTAHLAALWKMVRGAAKTARLSLPGGWTAVVNEDRLILLPKESISAQPSSFIYEVPGPGTLLIGESGDRLHFREKKGPFPLPKGALPPNTAWVDGEKIAWPLIVRTLRPGDRFTPWRGVGTKKVARFMMDRKIPREQRLRIPLVLCRGEVVWVAGQEIDRKFGLSPESSNILEMEYQKGD